MAVNLGGVLKSWSNRGFSFGVWSDPPGRVLKDYVHEVDKLILVLEGSVEIEIGGKVAALKPGKEVLVPAKTVHTVRNKGKNPSRWLYGYKLR
ncbi:MAG: cupin domain-containing protein [Elusimicrobia bacterium]|nr:cupin domain-containing protein [Elusimicrobiota bacterium]